MGAQFIDEWAKSRGLVPVPGPPRFSQVLRPGEQQQRLRVWLQGNQRGGRWDRFPGLPFDAGRLWRHTSGSRRIYTAEMKPARMPVFPLQDVREWLIAFGLQIFSTPLPEGRTVLEVREPRLPRFVPETRDVPLEEEIAIAADEMMAAIGQIRMARLCELPFPLLQVALERGECAWFVRDRIAAAVAKYAALRGYSVTPGGRGWEIWLEDELVHEAETKRDARDWICTREGIALSTPTTDPREENR